MVWPAIIAAALPAVLPMVQQLLGGSSTPTTTPAPAPTPAIPPPTSYPSSGERTTAGRVTVMPEMPVATGPSGGPVSVPEHTAAVGRAIVRQTAQETSPALSQIQQQLAHRATQIQATTEHRNIQQREAHRRQLLARLDRLEQRLGDRDSDLARQLASIRARLEPRGY